MVKSPFIRSLVKRIKRSGSISRIRIGFDAARNEGVNGNYFVDASVPSSGNGTSLATAFKTINEAMSVASNNQTIRVRGGTYRERVNFKSKSGVKLLGYGTEKPVISGASAVIPGWTLCTSNADVGAYYANIYKKIVSNSVFINSDPRSATPYEGDLELLPCMDWVENPAHPSYPMTTEQWHTADLVVTENSTTGYWRLDTVESVPLTIGQIVTGASSGATAFIEDKTASKLKLSALSGNFIPDEIVTDPLGGSATVLGNKYTFILGYQKNSINYTEAELQNADIFVHYSPNVNGRSAISSFTGGVIYLENTTFKYATDENQDKFALINILPAMKQGEWGWKDNGDGTTTIYIWPHNSVNAITFAERGACFDFGILSTDVQNDIEIRGFILERTASAGDSTDDLYALSRRSDQLANNWLIENCLIRNTWRAQRNYAPIHISYVNNLTIRNCEVRNAIGQFGMFINGGLNTPSTNLLVDKCVVDGVENSPYRFYGQYKAVVAFCKARNAGLASHSNLTNFYEGCHQILWFACDLTGGAGYWTWQEASQVSIVACRLMASEDGRGINDQNHSSTHSPADINNWFGGGYILNNEILPNPRALTDVRGIMLGNNNNPAVTWVCYNNISHGQLITETYVTSWANNLLTVGSSPSIATNDTISSKTTEYVDYLKGDFAYASNALVRTKAGKNLTSEIAALQAIFTHFTEWTTDINGDSINWSVPKIGPLQDKNRIPELSAVWYDLPAITGIPIVGSNLTVDFGFAKMSPYADPTFQWQRTNNDGRTWSDIPNAQSISYITDDVGYRIAAKLNRSGVTYRTTPTNTIASSYPLDNPAIITTKVIPYSGAFTTKQIETTSFISSSRPLLVIVAQRNSASANANLTVTAGSPSRAFGTGVLATFEDRSRRTSTEQQVLVVAPNSGNTTIQVESSISTGGVCIAVLDVDSNSIGATANSGASSVQSHNMNLNTTNMNSNILDCISFLDSSKTVSWVGANSLVSLSSGNNISSDIRLSVAWEQAPTITSYSVTANISGSATITSLAVEIKS